MNRKEQTFFFKRLAFLCNANIPLVESLEVLRDQATKKQAKIIGRIVGDIQEGRSLSKALGKFPNVFSGFCISIIQVGESSGTLSRSLEYLAEELKKKQLLRAKVVGAFIYPAVIACATLGITAFLILFLFPKITPIFKSLRATLPLSTRIVMGASTFLEHYGLMLLLCIALLIVGGVVMLKRSSRARLLFDRAVLHVPLVGGMLRLYHVSNSARTLGLLLSSGVTLSEAVLIAAEATQSLVYQEALAALSTSVARGERLSLRLMEQPHLFPPTLCHLVAVGERSGTLPETLLYVADLYDNEVDEFAKNISTLIEPALMVCMGLLVGFIAVSIITPIYAITQNLHT